MRERKEGEEGGREEGRGRKGENREREREIDRGRERETSEIKSVRKRREREITQCHLLVTLYVYINYSIFNSSSIVHIT